MIAHIFFVYLHFYLVNVYIYWPQTFIFATFKCITLEQINLVVVTTFSQY